MERLLCSHDKALDKKALDISHFQSPLGLAKISTLTPKFQDSHFRHNRWTNIPPPQHSLTDGRGLRRGGLYIMVSGGKPREPHSTPSSYHHAFSHAFCLSHCFLPASPPLHPGPLNTWQALPPQGLRSGPLARAWSSYKYPCVRMQDVHKCPAQGQRGVIGIRIHLFPKYGELPSQEPEHGLPSDKSMALLSQGRSPGGNHTSPQ